MHHEIPKMASKVSSLLHDLGEARPQRGEHMPAHAQLKAQTSQLAARPSTGEPGEEMAVQQEIAAAKHSARNPTYRQAFARGGHEAGGRFRGGRIEAKVEAEIAAARKGAVHHLPYGRAPGHGEHFAGPHGSGLARELEMARIAAKKDEKMQRARHMQKEASAEKHTVSVEHAYSMPNRA